MLPGVSKRYLMNRAIMTGSGVFPFWKTPVRICSEVSLSILRRAIREVTSQHFVILKLIKPCVIESLAKMPKIDKVSSINRFSKRLYHCVKKRRDYWYYTLLVDVDQLHSVSWDI